MPVDKGVGVDADADGVDGSSVRSLNVLLAGRWPSERSDASDAGRPAAYELMIFLSALGMLARALIDTKSNIAAHLVVEIVVAPSWYLLRLNCLAELQSLVSELFHVPFKNGNSALSHLHRSVTQMTFPSDLETGSALQYALRGGLATAAAPF